jgi:hypothetical protein
VEKQTPIAKWLAQHGKTVLWLAQQMGTSYNATWRWVKGVSRPALANAQKLKKLTGLSLDELTE